MLLNLEIKSGFCERFFLDIIGLLAGTVCGQNAIQISASKKPYRIPMHGLRTKFSEQDFWRLVVGPVGFFLLPRRPPLFTLS